MLAINRSLAAIEPLLRFYKSLFRLARSNLTRSVATRKERDTETEQDTKFFRALFRFRVPKKFDASVIVV